METILAFILTAVLLCKVSLAETLEESPHDPGQPEQLRPIHTLIELSAAVKVVVA